MTELVVPIFASDSASVISQAEAAAAAGADVVELRLDLCDPGICKELINQIKTLALPAIVTNRSPAEGGSSRLSDSERLQLLLDADQAGAAWIDVELSCLEQLPARPQRARLILSYHDFKGMGDDLAGKIMAMLSAEADVAKLAVTPADAGDLAIIETLYQQAPHGRLTAIAMGEEGLPSRLLAGAWGAAFTYAALDDDHDTAPGQPSVRSLIDTYRIHEQGPSTCIFGVIGDPVAHSLSPIIHNAGFAHLDMDAVYVPFLVHDARDFWSRCGAWIDGLSITIPHKHALLDSVNEYEDLVSVTSAMNTIYRTEDKLIGANTDATAALLCVQEQAGSLEEKRCLILGAGGVSRAIAHTMHSAHARVFITNRTMERAEQLARDVGCKTMTLEDAVQEDWDIIINGTSVGMNSDESPWPADRHRTGRIVFDTVYTPLETRLLLDAQSAGSFPVCGLSMFLIQAYQQFERWTNTFAPEAAMRRAVLEKLGLDPELFGTVGKNNTACWNNGV